MTMIIGYRSQPSALDLWFFKGMAIIIGYRPGCLHTATTTENCNVMIGARLQLVHYGVIPVCFWVLVAAVYGAFVLEFWPLSCSFGSRIFVFCVSSPHLYSLCLGLWACG